MTEPALFWIPKTFNEKTAKLVEAREVHVAKLLAERELDDDVSLLPLERRYEQLVAEEGDLNDEPSEFVQNESPVDKTADEAVTHEAPQVTDDATNES